MSGAMRRLPQKICRTLTASQVNTSMDTHQPMTTHQAMNTHQLAEPHTILHVTLKTHSPQATKTIVSTGAIEVGPAVLR